MSERRDLLIEIGTEELPPGALNQLAQALLSGLVQGLGKAQFDFAADQARFYASPRRLTCLIPDLSERQPDREMERRGPAVTQAFDENGQPKPAATGFARSLGIEVDQLERLTTDKGEWLYYRFTERGKSLAKILPELLNKAIERLPIPKPMRWGDHETRFVRPVHWLVVLHGADVIPLQALGQTAGRTTYGHRIHAPGGHEIATAADYLDVLRQAYVVADPEIRRQRIIELSEQAAATAGLKARLTVDLVNEVTALVEWPVAVTCSFDEDFLQVPPEALISSMESHQKFFPLLRQDGSLSPRFVVMANIESTAPDRVRDGFERVVRPRLADARFFWDQDRKRPLASYSTELEKVVFQKKLGTMADKTRRVAELAKRIAVAMDTDPTTATRAAELARCDLMTQMVGEFPDLQGTMGRYYAVEAGESEAVARAIEEHYRPRHAGDEIASCEAGRILAVAEKTETLLGIFAAGLKPTGAKDPYALRRAALGLVRTLIEGGLELEIRWLLEQSAEILTTQIGVDATLIDAVSGFVFDRLTSYLRDQGIATEVIQSVAALEIDHLVDFHSRVHAVGEFSALPQAESLSAANKRCANILRQAGSNSAATIDTEHLRENAEIALHQAISQARTDLQALLEQRDYTSALNRLAHLEPQVNQFFDNVMVMAEDKELRNNRLALVKSLRQLFLSIADIGQLGG